MPVPNGTPDERVYRAFARDWLIKLRSRPRDETQLTFQYGQIEKTTDDNLKAELKAAGTMPTGLCSKWPPSMWTRSLSYHRKSRQIMPSSGCGGASESASRQQPVTWTAIMTAVYTKDKLVESNVLVIDAKEFKPVLEE